MCQVCHFEAVEPGVALCMRSLQLHVTVFACDGHVWAITHANDQSHPICLNSTFYEWDGIKLASILDHFHLQYLQYANIVGEIWSHAVTLGRYTADTWGAVTSEVSQSPSLVFLPSVYQHHQMWSDLPGLPLHTGTCILQVIKYWRWERQGMRLGERHFPLFLSGNCTPGSKSYSDLVDTWADWLLFASTSSYSSLVQRLPI